MPLALTSCATGVHHEISEYFLTCDMGEKTEFHILQLTDTHVSDKDNQDEIYAYMDRVISTVQEQKGVDMIIITGDLFTFASKSTATRYFDYFESKKIPWTATYGNHDEQVYFSVDWMTGYLNDLTAKGGYCLFKDIQDDDVTGNANFVIDLTKNHGAEVFERLIIMDSNRYVFGLDNGYDCFKPSQIEWYKNVIDAKKNSSDPTPESLMFYHIPLPEVNDAYEKGTKFAGDTDPEGGEKREKCCPSEENSGFFDVIKEKGSTKGMFFGHDHINNFAREYEGVLFSYGTKTGNRIYFDEDMMGGQLITINQDHSLTLERFNIPFKEAK